MIDPLSKDDTLKLRMYRARIVLAARYLQWRAEALTHGASWDADGSCCGDRFVGEAMRLHTEAESILVYARNPDKNLLEGESVCTVVSGRLKYLSHTLVVCYIQHNDCPV